MSTETKKCCQNHQNYVQTSSYERLLDSAEKIFSQKGFSGTTIRDIITDAKCNIAAINYHFGSKEKLYFEVYSRLMIKLRQERIASIEKVMSDKHDEALLEKLLMSFAHAFIHPLSSKDDQRCVICLLIRESLDRLMSPETFIKNVMIPVSTVFGEALIELYPSLTHKRAMSCVQSVIGQLLHVVFQQEMAKDVQDLDNFSLPETQECINHIVTFSAAAIRNFAKESAS